MTAENTPGDLLVLPDGRFTGRSEFTALVRQALLVAAAEGWREITVCDADFADWPLGERAVSEALQAWSQGGRRFTMLARNYDEVVRRHARFVTWRRTWSHIIECRSSAHTSADDMPSALLGPTWAFERLDPVRCSGVSGHEAVRRVALAEKLRERLATSTSSFAASTLGL